MLDKCTRCVYNNKCQEGKTKGAPEMKIEIKFSVEIKRDKKKSPAQPKPIPSNSNTISIINAK